VLNDDNGGNARARGAVGRGGELERVVWEREMRRLGVGIRVLLVVLLALAVRVVVSGLNVAATLSLVIVCGLLVAASLLTRQGRRLEPPARSRARREPSPRR
jgi:hypothetical protein